MRGQQQGPRLGADRYVLTSRLGEGGMATVFLAWDTKLKVWRAIKVLLPAFVSKSKLRKRFENEAHAMARLEHSNIVRIYDVGLEGKVPFMVMELAEGGCIIDWLDRHGPMPPALALQVIDELCAGIHSAHEAGIVHRDIKPHNILVTRAGVCKVTDFGIAQVMDQDALTKTGSVMGTWGFMAPEQRIDAKNVDERADVFGIGATLYNLLVNRQPTELYVADQDDEVFEGIPADLLPTILKACSYKPKDRQGSVPELQAELASLLPGQPEVPSDTPSLVLEARDLPDSVESANFSPTIVDELEEALGAPTDTSDPGVTAETPVTAVTGRVLPYYMPQSRPEPKRDVPNARPLGASPGAPSYIDAPEHERTGPTLRPLPADPTYPTATLEPPAPEASSGSDLGVRLLAVVLVALLMMLGVLGWGMVSVNGAEGVYLQAERGVEQQMRMELQGPVIDGLGLAGADKAVLDAAHQAYERAPRAERFQGAVAYLKLVQSSTQQVGSGPSIDKMRPVVAELEASVDHAAMAHQDWVRISADFPGSLAVGLGLALTP